MKSQIIVECQEGGSSSFRGIPVKCLEFNGGEVNVSLDFGELCLASVDFLSVTARIVDTAGIIALAQVSDILNNYFVGVTRELVLPYVPYARQDRRCNYGESLGIKVFSNIINSLRFSSVTVVDPHSDVTTALIDNVCVIDKEQIFKSSERSKKLHLKILDNYDTFVAPDAGAAKEVFKLAQTFGKGFIQGMKHRDTATGNLSGFSYQGDIEGKKLLIVDDLVERGGTFNGLADVMLKGNPKSIGLYATHGLFSNDLTELSKRFNNIYTTNTFKADLYKNQNLKCIYKI